MITGFLHGFPKENHVWEGNLAFNTNIVLSCARRRFDVLAWNIYSYFVSHYLKRTFISTFFSTGTNFSSLPTYICSQTNSSSLNNYFKIISSHSKTLGSFQKIIFQKVFPIKKKKSWNMQMRNNFCGWLVLVVVGGGEFLFVCLRFLKICFYVF